MGRGKLNNTREHQKLVDDLLFAVGSLPYARVWPQINGLFRKLYSEEKVKIGVNGMADIGGLLMLEEKMYDWRKGEPIGLRLEIECKTGGGKLSKEQIRYRDMITRFGGIYIVARSVEQVLTEIKCYR